MIFREKSDKKHRTEFHHKKWQSACWKKTSALGVDTRHCLTPEQRRPQRPSLFCHKASIAVSIWAMTRWQRFTRDSRKAEGRIPMATLLQNHFSGEFSGHCRLYFISFEWIENLCYDFALLHSYEWTWSYRMNISVFEWMFEGELIEMSI